MKITGVCISKDNDVLNLPNVAFYCLTRGWEPIYRHNRSKKRIEYLTSRRNLATEAALEAYPETTDILAVDSYYLSQPNKVAKLIADYSEMPHPCILGASIWWRDKTRILERLRYYDTWSTPELEHLSVRRESELPNGILRVSSVGACYIFPRPIWDSGVRYVVPEPFPDAGIFHNYLCKASGLPVYLDCQVRFWRDHTDSDVPNYGWIKRLRCSLGIRDRVNRLIASK